MELAGNKRDTEGLKKVNIFLQYFIAPKVLHS